MKNFNYNKYEDPKRPKPPQYAPMNHNLEEGRGEEDCSRMIFLILLAFFILVPPVWAGIALGLSGLIAVLGIYIFLSAGVYHLIIKRDGIVIINIMGILLYTLVAFLVIWFIDEQLAKDVLFDIEYICKFPFNMDYGTATIIKFSVFSFIFVFSLICYFIFRKK